MVLILSFCFPIALIKFGTISVNKNVPENTRIVPNQWPSVNGLLKYTIESINEKNLRKVMTNVTVNDEHSVVKTYTELIHIYWVNIFPIKYKINIGNPIFIAGNSKFSLDIAISACSIIFLEYNRNPGKDSKCWKYNTISISINNRYW